MTYRPRKLKQAKTPLSATVWRYFLAPMGTTDDYYECKADTDAKGHSGVSADEFLGLYFLNDWKDLWQQHRTLIEAEWRKRFPNPDQLRAHREWALQSYSERLNYCFKLEREKEQVQ